MLHSNRQVVEISTGCWPFLQCNDGIVSFDMLMGKTIDMHDRPVCHAGCHTLVTCILVKYTIQINNL